MPARTDYLAGARMRAASRIAHAWLGSGRKIEWLWMIDGERFSHTVRHAVLIATGLVDSKAVDDETWALAGRRVVEMHELDVRTEGQARHPGGEP